MALSLSDWLQARVLEDGIVEIYKPYGLPSTAAVEISKVSLNQKVGHGGTLDPLAEGSLILGVGEGTKKLTQFLGGDKVYKASFLLGMSSPSGDFEQFVSIGQVQNPNELDIRVAINELKQPYTQQIPTYSAVRVDGQRSYDLAREGVEDIEQKSIETRLISVNDISINEITALELSTILQKNVEKLAETQNVLTFLSDQFGVYIYKKYDSQFESWKEAIRFSMARILEIPRSFIKIDVELEVPKGTYIRSVASDIAKKLGTVGILLSLVRKSTNIH